MISLSVAINDISGVMRVFDTIQFRKWTGYGTPESLVTDHIALTEYTTISGGIDTINNRQDVSDVLLNRSYYQYYFTDPVGYAYEWYISRYYSTATQTTSGWSVPMQGEPGDLYFNMLFLPEVAFSAADQLIIDRIRLWIGDPIGIRREYGEEAMSSIHPDGKTYEMDQKGWPAYINMGGIPFTDSSNPSVNGYKYLRFRQYINDICLESVTYSGICGTDITKDIANGVDIWYNTFRNSDREIMEAYNNCPPPSPLTVDTANSEAYMLQTAIDLLRKELWEDATTDGAIIKDEGSSYDPSAGLRVRKDLLDDLQKRLDKLIKAIMLSGISGVLID